MPLTYLYSFSDTTTGNTVVVQVDKDTGALSAIWGSGPDRGQLAYSAISNHTEGEVIYTYCQDTTLVTIKARHNYPFVESFFTLNSAQCIIVPPCDLTITSVVTTAETAQSLRDGTATLNYSFSDSGTISYSLDNINWQSANTFVGLFPGAYKAYVKAARPDGTFCYSDAYSFSIAAGAPKPVVLYPWQEKICKFFRLIKGTVTTIIREPVKWDQINFIGKRDRDWHGYRGMFSDGQVDLEFPCDSGKEIIESAYETDGNDAEVFFQYGYTFRGQEYILFPGKLNFNTYKQYPGRVAVAVDRADYNQLLQTRFDAKVSMSDAVGFDGAPISIPPPFTIPLHAKAIAQTFKNLQFQNSYNELLDTETNVWYMHPDMSAPQVSEIEEFFSIPLGVSEEEPGAFEKYDWKLKRSGAHTIALSYSMILEFLFLSPLPGGQESYTVQNIFRVNDEEIPVGDPLIGLASTTGHGFVPIVYSYNISRSFNAGDRIFIYTKFTTPGKQTMVANLTQNGVSMTINAVETVQSSTCNGWLIYDTIDHCIRSITNDTSLLQSTFLSTLNASQARDGQGSLYITTNGFQIRKFNTGKNPLKVSLKDALTSVKNIFCLGYGSEPTPTKEVVRVERVPYFYRNKEILVIEETERGSYSVEVAKDMIYNQLEFGYEKYQESGYNTLDEFNTYHQHATSIKSNSLKLTARSSLIASGYSIEDSRRQQFADTATDSYNNDEEAFIISVRRDTAGYVPEKAEAFQTVTGVISPETSYNLRISPFRQLLNWSVWLQGSLYYKPVTDSIKNTFVAQNGALTTQFLDTEQNPVGDINKLQWQEGQDVSLTNIEVEEKIWRPEYLNFKTSLTPDKIQRIDESMRGNWSTDTNYGYIVVKDPDGAYQAGYLLDLTYNHSTEQATFQLLRKAGAVIPGTPTDSVGGIGEPCCGWLTINGCRVIMNGQKISIGWPALY